MLSYSFQNDPIIQGNESSSKRKSRERFRKRRRLKVSQHAEKHRVLDSVTSDAPGPWRNSKTPYLIEIMDSLGNDLVQVKFKDGSFRSINPRIVVFRKPTQVGGTAVGDNWLQWVMNEDPSSFTYTLPTDALLRRAIKSRIDPMIEASKCLVGKIASAKSRDGGNNQTEKSFEGGLLNLLAATAKNARSINSKRLNQDEYEEYIYDKEQGDLAKLLDKRMLAFRGAKCFKNTTPKIEDLSRVDEDILKSTDEYYYVPCPSCGHKQTLDVYRIDCIDGEPDTAYYPCINEQCGYHIQEYKKAWMLSEGEWIAHNFEADGLYRGFSLNAAYSPFPGASWPMILREKWDAEGDPDLEKVFINCFVGKSYKITGEKVDDSNFDRLKHEYENDCDIPMGAGVLIGGIDTQKDRIELYVWGYGERRESWLVDHRVFTGSTDEEEVWEDLADVIATEEWQHENGKFMKLYAFGLDTAGGIKKTDEQEYSSTTKAYEFISKYGRKLRGFALIGRSGWNLPAVNHGTDKKVGRSKKKFKLYTVGVDDLKRTIYKNLEKAGSENLKESSVITNFAVCPGYFHFPSNEDKKYFSNEEFFKQLTAEELIAEKKKSGDLKSLKWENTRKSRRNEALDCRVYADACLYLVSGSRKPNNFIVRKLQEFHSNNPQPKRRRRSGVVGGME